MMDLDELRTVQRTERQKDTLQHLRDSFYQDVADYVATLKERRDAAADASDDPFGDPDVRRLSDEIETAEDVVESLYERRVGKVVKAATFAAADMGDEQGGLTDEERELYDDLVARIRENRETVLDTLSDARSGSEPASGDAAGSDAGGVPETAEPTPEVTTPEPPSPADDATAERSATTDEPTAADDLLAEAMGDGSDSAAGDGPMSDGGGQPTAADPDLSQPTRDGRPPASDDERPATDEPDAPVATPGATNGADSSAAAERGTAAGADAADAAGAADRSDGTASVDADRTTVRITRDVGEILGVDERAYSLEREDVVTLPADNAEPLLRKDAAERLD